MNDLWDWINRLLLSDNVLMTLLVVPALLGLELLRPARKSPASHYLFGFSYWMTNLLLLAVISPMLNTAVATGVQAIGFGLIDLRGYGLPGLWGALLALLISTFVVDFFYYWFHRALHHNRYLWQTHLLHHSDEHMNVMTAQRGHFTEFLLSPLFIALPMAVLFDLPPVTIGVLALLPYAYQFFAHANLNVGFGPFWWLLISPNYHRIHHSIERRHHNKNFTNWFPVWDILFGTLYLPEKGECPATGVDGIQIRTLPEAFLHPFVNWRRMLSRETGAAVSQAAIEAVDPEDPSAAPKRVPGA